jgi:hypothetical protein
MNIFIGKRWLLAALLAVIALPVVGGTYKWVDENGKVHYSDKPVEGAEEVKLPQLPTYDTSNLPKEARSQDTDKENDDDEQAASYSRFEFISPKQDQIFWNTGGSVPVQLALQPALRSGHQVKVYLDGTLKSGPSQSLGLTLTEMYRGTYSVRAVVVDRNDREIARTSSVTFHVKQTSVQN